MGRASTTQVAIVDYGMGNLFSVAQACSHVGLRSTVTSCGAEIVAADALILPGVGAFGDAMGTLSRLDLAPAILDFVATGKPIIGICLGMQLLMQESYEFGRHRGLGIIDGAVVRLKGVDEGARKLKVPQVGWNRIYPARQSRPQDENSLGSNPWRSALLEGVPHGEYMYFSHSFYATPADPNIAISTTQYGGAKFCSSFQLGNIFACQFHPERSGSQGLRVYRNLAALITTPELEALDA